MFIRTTRLLLIIIASVFLGMCIVWWVMYTASDKPTGMLKLGIFGTVILIFAIVGLQLWENRKLKKEEKKLLVEKEKADAIKANMV